MTPIERWAYVFAVICYAPLPPSSSAAPLKPAPIQHDSPARSRAVLSQRLPALNGDSLSLQMVRVHYGPGESSQPHSHPCPVAGYVLEGSVRMQVQAPGATSPGRVTIYHKGESFYEAPNGRHLISANASQSQPATFLATFVCDHNAPLTAPEPETQAAPSAHTDSSLHKKETHP